MSSIQGFSLMSFSITCLVSALLMSGAIESVFVAQKALGSLKLKVSRHENTMLAALMLQDKLARAGLSLCQHLNDYRQVNFTRSAGTLSSIIRRQPIRLATSSSQQSVALGLNKRGSGQIVANSDILLLEHIAQTQVISTPLIKGRTSIVLSNRPRWKRNSFLLLDDCQHMALVKISRFQLIRGGGAKIHLTKPLTFNFAAGVFISHFTLSAFYVGKTLRRDIQGKALSALYEKSLSGARRRHELLPSIVALHIRPIIKNSGKISATTISAMSPSAVITGISLTILGAGAHNRLHIISHVDET